MSNVIIGVGGSGQHIIHAYLRVLALGNAGSVDVPHVYIIDADAQSQQIANRRSQLVPDIQSLHEYLRHRGANKKTKEANFDIIRPYSQNLSTSSDLTVKNVLLAQKSNTSEEINAFFYEQDLNIKVSEGMHANPKVGSTIFGEKLGRVLDSSGKIDTNNKQLLQREFFSLFDDDVTGVNTTDCNIVIVGSVFGGTGSGIIPTLARTFNEIINNSSSGRTINLATVATLPWFQLKPGEDGTTGSAFDVGKLKRNTAFALRNFQYELQSNNNNAVSSIFIQSGNQWQDIQRPSAGDFDQPEHTHVVNLIAANAVQHSFAKHFDSNELYMPMSQLPHEIQQGHFHPHTSAHLHFKDFSKDGHFASLWMLLVKNALTILVLQAFMEVLDGYSEGAINHPVLGDSASQFGSVKQLLNEIREKFGVSLESKKAWLGLKSVTFVPKIVATHLREALAIEQRQYQNTLNWICRHDYDNQNASGIIPEFRPYHNISSAGNANSLWSQLVGANEQTGFEKDELWQSCALKILEKTILNDEGGINTTLQAKINTILEQGENDNSKYASLASNIASSVFKNLNQYVTPEEVFGEKFSNYRNANDNAQSISHVQLQMQQQRDKIAHYGAMDWNLQLAGDVAALDIMDIDHPKTLHWLDALYPTSTTANLINVIQLDERIAQGVPNILASFLLQKWRLGIQNPVTVAQSLESNNTAYYKIVANKFQSTQMGLYLYAQRIIEAAFWLLISGATEVTYTAIELDGNNAYHRWLKRELLTQSWSDSQLGMIVTNDSERTPLFLWNGYYWSLAANHVAEAYFAKLLQTMQLPTLRYRYADAFSRKETGDKSKIKSLDKFFAARLDALRSRLKSRQSLSENANENILLTALTGILADLPPASTTKSVVAPIYPPIELGCRNVVELTEIGTSQSIVNVSGYLIQQPQVIMLDKLPDNNGNVVNVEQFLPVKKEYWQQPEVIEQLSKDRSERVHTRVRFNGESNNECSIQYTKLYVPELGWMEFQQGTESSQPTIAITPYDLAFGVGVWPNFKVEGWQYYFISVDIEKRNVYEDLASKLYTALGSDKITVTVYSQDLQQSKVFGFDAIPLKVDFVPAIIELSCGDTIIGTQPIMLTEDLKSGNHHIKCIGLDFGTSNTCMAKAYSDQGQIKRENLNLANTAHEPRMEWLVYSETDDSKGQEEWLKNRSAYYLQRQAQVTESDSYTIPSEILLGLSNRTNPDGSNQTDVQLKAMKEAVDKSQVLIKGINLNAPIFTPLCSDFLGVSNTDSERIKFFNSLLEGDGIQRIYGNIKWPQDTSGSDYALSSKLRATYVEQVLIGVLARLRYSGVTDIDYVYVTRPDAFMFENTTFANTYARDMKTVLGKLASQTGVSLKKPEVIEVSETEAALQMSMINPNESYAIIDMGGGTTDIDIELSYADVDGGSQRLKYSSSIKWAGNDLLAAMLVEQSPIRKFLAHKINMQSDDTNKSYYDTLLASVMKLQIRNGIRIVDDLPSDPGEVSKVAQMFFESIYEYIFIKIKLLMEQAELKSIGCLKGKKLNIVLQGNGFKLSDYFSHDTHPLPSMNEGHYAPLVWESVFADYPGSDEIALNVSYSENSKEHMIRDGAGNIADQMYTNKISSELEHPKMLYPANMFNKNMTDKPLLVDYDKDASSPVLAENLMDKESMLPVIETLFPYTKKYWSDTGRVAYLFSNNKYGNNEFYDINAMYLTGGVSGDTSWNFYKAMTEKLEGK